MRRRSQGNEDESSKLPSLQVVQGFEDFWNKNVNNFPLDYVGKLYERTLKKLHEFQGEPIEENFFKWVLGFARMLAREDKRLNSRTTELVHEVHDSTDTSTPHPDEEHSASITSEELEDSIELKRVKKRVRRIANARDKVQAQKRALEKDLTLREIQRAIVRNYIEECDGLDAQILAELSRGTKGKEIAKKCGISPNAVYKRISRFKHRMNKEIVDLK